MKEPAVLFDFYNADALLDRLTEGVRGQDDQIVFVVGSGLTAPTRPGGPGVPGVDGVIELIRASFAAVEREKLDADLSTAGNKYQEAFRFLLGRRGQKAANGIIKKAVAGARRAVVRAEGDPAYEITSTTSDESCRGFDNDAGGWHLTPGVDALGRLVAMADSRFSRMVVTTNFDPLIGAAIATHGGTSFRSFLYRDGSLNQTDGPGTHVVHLHGYWYGSDTLHTPQQLVQERPQLKASLSHLLRGHTVVVMAYGGWDDAFTQAMMSVVLDDSSFPEVLWCFRGDQPALADGLAEMVRPGVGRGRVMLYSGVDANVFLPRLADAWTAPSVPESLADREGMIAFAADTEDKKLAVADRPSPTQIDTPYSKISIERLLREDGPPKVEFLVGREQELKLLLGSQFTVGFVTGFGGQGKSALVASYFDYPQIVDAFAVRVWRDCRERSARFEDQVAAIVEALGGGRVSASELAKQSMESLADLFVNLTRAAPVLIVFDNVDHYVDLERRMLVGAPGAFVARLLASGTCSQLIMTCRPPIQNDVDGSFVHHLKGLDLTASIELFGLRKAGSEVAAIQRAHDATNGHAFWLDLLAAQVARRTPVVLLDDLLLSISEGGGEIPDATLRSIWNSLREREQITLQVLAESLRPASQIELADFARRQLSWKNLTKALGLLRDLNLVVLKIGIDQVETFELHPLIRTFILKTFERKQRTPFIVEILASYTNWLAPYLSKLGFVVAPEAVHRSLEAAELCINAERYDDAIERLRAISTALRRSEPPGEFVRVMQRLLTLANLTSLKRNPWFDSLYVELIRALANLGRTAEALEELTRYETTLEGKDARYINYCDMQCYLHWTDGDLALAVKWGTEGERLRSTGVDTVFSTEHNLALAQRDSGAIDEALRYFLKGTSIEDAIDPQKADVDLGGPFYGNIGRCLHLMGQAEPAIICYRKSARFVQEETETEHLENQAYIRQWVGELLVNREDREFARPFLEAALAKWEIVSPPKAAKLKSFMMSTFGDESLKSDPADAEGHFVAWIYGLHRLE